MAAVAVSGSGSAVSDASNGDVSSAALIAIVTAEEQLAFHAVVPHGSTLKSVAELLVRCSPQIPVTVDAVGIVFTACDPASGRLIRIQMRAGDLHRYRFFVEAPLRCTLESASLYAVCMQLKRRDAVVLYATTSGQFGSLVDYSGRQNHTKHSTICVRPAAVDPPVPVGYRTAGVPVPSNILQRTLREYKNLGKRIVLTGNASYIHLAADARFSLHRSDNLFGTLDARHDDVTVELSISTLSRVLKVTQFGQHVRVTCEPGLPVRLTAELGRCGSRVDVYIQQDSATLPFGGVGGGGGSATVGGSNGGLIFM